MDTDKKTIVILMLGDNDKASITKVRPKKGVAAAFHAHLKEMTGKKSRLRRMPGDRTNTQALFALLHDPATCAEFDEYSEKEKNYLNKIFNNAIKHPRAWRPWSPAEKWRSKQPEERASEFFERVYMVLPYEERPYSHQLANEKNGDRDLYDALTMVITNNRRLDRTGEPGSLFAARSMADLMPMLGVERSLPKRPASKGVVISIRTRQPVNDLG